MTNPFATILYKKYGRKKKREEKIWSNQDSFPPCNFKISLRRLTSLRHHAEARLSVLVAITIFVVLSDHSLALAQKASDGTVFSLAPVLDGERVMTGAGGKLGVIERPALLERQVDEVRLGQACTIGTATVANEGRQLRIDVQVDDCFAHALSLVIVGCDDDLVEDRVEPALTNLVLLSLTIADGDGDDEEVVMGAAEYRSGVGEELGLTEEWRVADVFADQCDFAATAHLLLLAKLAVSGNHGVRKAVALEPVHMSVAEVGVAKSGDSMLLVETKHRHQETKALDGAVEVGLALEDRSVNVDEERSHLAVAGAEIASWHAAFAGHSDLPVDRRFAQSSESFTGSVGSSESTSEVVWKSARTRVV